MVKSLEFFKASTSASEVKFWSNRILSRLHVMEKALLLHLFKVSVDHLFYNLESGKRNYSFGKSLEFWIKNLYEPCLENVYFVVQMTGLVMSRCINA